MTEERIHTDPTAALPGGLDAAGIARLRRHLSMNAHLVSNYGERLLDDVAGPQTLVLRPALLEIMSAARQVLMEVRAAFTASSTFMHPREVSGLIERIKPPQAAIIDRITALLRSNNSSGFDDLVLADLRAMRSAAIQLGSAPQPVPSGSAQAPAEASSAAQAPKAGPRSRATDQARVLVAEDSPDARKILVSYLKDLGHKVDAVDNGAKALAKARGGDYDIVLSDIEMPELDGFGLLAALKQDPATKDVPVVMISSLDDLQSVVRCIERGADDHLSKPFEPALLSARLSTLLERKRLRDAEAAYLADVGRVTSAAATVETGTYETGTLAEIAKRTDALGDLARVFDEMADGVRRRSQRMASQLTDLQDEISRLRKPDEANEASMARDLGLVPGDVFAGRYEVVSILGQGGMGLVVRAHDRTLREDVAIKTIRNDLLDGTPGIIERFKTELRLARMLTHKNIVRCHDMGEYNGVHYLTMEFVEGVTLRELIEMRGRLTVPVTLAVGAQLADALAVAHEQGVVHRDIKPMNLLLTRNGTLKVMDFGIARRIEATEHQTGTGMVLGTPHYMAPELFFGGAPDSRADIYSMGVVLFQCLTGTVPSESESPMGLAAKLLTEDPTGPAELVPDIPSALDALVLKLIARRPEERHDKAAVVAEALRAIG